MFVQCFCLYMSGVERVKYYVLPYLYFFQAFFYSLSITSSQDTGKHINLGAGDPIGGFVWNEWSVP